MIQLRIFVSLRKEIKRLSYKEKGQLLDAMLAYAEDKTLLPLTGKADVLWDVIQERIDAQHKSYEDKCKNLSIARDQNPCNNKMLSADNRLTSGNTDLTSREVNLTYLKDKVQVQEQVQVQDKLRKEKDKSSHSYRVRKRNFVEHDPPTDEQLQDIFLDLNKEVPDD